MRLSRCPCPHCREDTLHVGYTCNQCKADNTPACMRPQLRDYDGYSMHKSRTNGGKKAKLNPRRAKPVAKPAPKPVEVSIYAIFPDAQARPSRLPPSRPQAVAHRAQGHGGL